MESYAPSPDDMMNQNSSRVPTGMEEDTRADEEIIDQTGSSSEATELQPAPIGRPQAGEETPVDDLASSIAYALDGSGMNEHHLTSAPRDLPPSDHKVITEGITGAGLNEEEDNLAGR